MLSKLMPYIWLNVYADDDPPPAGDPPAGDPSPPAGDPPKGDGPDEVKVFSQKDVDRIVQSRLKKTTDEQKKLIGEINALKAKSDLTTEERKEWEERLETLNNSLLSEQELRAKELKRKEQEFTNVISEKDSEISKWQTMFTTSTITRALTDAAVEHKAFHPEQIVSLLDRKTRLVEDLHDGKPTGRLVPKVRFEDTDDKGKPVTLDISPSEAIKRMTEIGKYQNLFEGKGTGGVGQRNHADGGKKPALALQAKDPAAYIKGRRDGSITLDE